MAEEHRLAHNKVPVATFAVKDTVFRLRSGHRKKGIHGCQEIAVPLSWLNGPQSQWIEVGKHTFSSPHRTF